MKAKSIKGKSAEEIKTALAESMANGFQPTLAIVFLSVAQDRKTICSILEKAGIAIFGSTTDGEEVLLGFQEVAGNQVNAFGAAADDDYAFEETWVFTNDWESNHGMVCIALNEKK